MSHKHLNLLLGYKTSVSKPEARFVEQVGDTLVMECAFMGTMETDVVYNVSWHVGDEVVAMEELPGGHGNQSVSQLIIKKDSGYKISDGVSSNKWFD